MSGDAATATVDPSASAEVRRGGAVRREPERRAERRHDNPAARTGPASNLIASHTPAMVPAHTAPLVPVHAPALIAAPIAKPAATRLPVDEATREDDVADDERHGEPVSRGAIAIPRPPPGGAGARVQRTSLPELFVAIVTPDRDEAGGLLVEDGAQTLTSGQMRKADFMRRLRTEVCRVAEDELRRAGRSAAGCPYIDQMLSYYEGRSAEHLERAVRRYAPETRSLRDAHDYLPVLSARLGRGIARWATTGQMPEDVPNETLAALAGARNGLVGAIAGIAGLSRKATPGAEPATVDAGALVRQLGPGQALEGGTQARMERALGHSFAGVRIHADDRAAALSHDLAARAFTIGPHVAFGAGELRPGTPHGDALLAHELAHVVQQGTAAPTGDVPLGAAGDPLEHDADLAAAAAVEQLHAPAGAEPTRPRRRLLGGALQLQRCQSGARTAAELSSIPTGPLATVRPGFAITGTSPGGFGDPRKVYFERGSSEPDGTEIDEIQSAVQYEGAPGSLRNQALDIRGFRSEDEPAELARARAQHVAELLQGWGHSAARNVIAEPDAGEGRFNYRELRMVELTNPGAASSAPTSQTTPCTPTNRNAIRDAIARASTLLETARSALATPTRADVAPAFRGVFGDPRDSAFVGRVNANYASLRTFLDNHVALPAHHQCGTALHPACRGTSLAAHQRGEEMTTLCPRFFTTSGDQPALTLIHEASHGAPWDGARAGHNTEDFAYDNMRTIRFLPPETTLANADSYVLFIRWLLGRSAAAPAGTEPAMGHGTADPHPMLTGVEGADAERALAFVQQRVMFAHQTMRNMYNFLQDHAASGTAISGGDAEPAWRAIAPAIFPGRDPALPPVRQDVYEAAGILDRLTPQYDLLRTQDQGITMRRVTGPTRWVGSDAPLGSVDIGNDFRTAGNHEAQLQVLLRALVGATGSIDASLRESYMRLYETARVLRGGSTAP